LRPELCIIQSNPASHRRPAFPSSIQRPRLPRLGMTPTPRIQRGRSLKPSPRVELKRAIPVESGIGAVTGCTALSAPRIPIPPNAARSRPHSSSSDAACRGHRARARP